MKKIALWISFYFLGMMPCSAKAQTASDPCRVYANVAGWDIDMKITASGTSFDNSQKHTLLRTAASSIILDHLRAESTILGPNGEVYEVVYEGRAKSSVSVDDKSYSRNINGWQLSNQQIGSGDISPAYDAPQNAFISFQPGFNGTCSAILNVPTVIDVTASSLSNKSWTSLILPYGWGPGNVAVPQPGQLALLPGLVQTLFLDPLPGNSDPSGRPPAYDRSLTVKGPGGNGAVVDWNINWHVEPILGCDCGCNPSGNAKHASSLKQQAQTGSQPIISGLHELWWFNGEAPNQQTFPTHITLEANPKTNCIYEWSITAGSTRVAFAGPTNLSKVELTSLSYSIDREDVKVQVKRNGIVSEQFPITVLAPFSLEPHSTSNEQSGGTGYLTTICYVIKDNFSRPILDKIPFNEYWPVPNPVVKGSPDVSDNWTQVQQPDGGLGPGPPPGALVQGVCDDISDPAAPRVPNATYNPLSQAQYKLVAKWPQTFFVGSTTNGRGVVVQTDTAVRYQDHGAHENVCSPVLFPGPVCRSTQ